jgi:DNA-binding MarR family transcriptional regulator
VTASDAGRAGNGAARGHGQGRAETGGMDSLSEVFWSVAGTLRRSTQRALAPWDVSPSQVRALAVLAEHGDCRLGTLAQHLRIAPRSATEVVDGLEDRGLIIRRSDPDDRRATVVTLTPPGRDVVSAIGAARSAEADRFFAVLDDGDRADLARILRLLQRPGGGAVEIPTDG